MTHSNEGMYSQAAKILLEPSEKMLQSNPGKSARTVLLEEATKITSADRNKAYGNPEDNFRNIANLWNAYLTAQGKADNLVNSQDVAHMMILMKVARLATNHAHRDSLVDVAGYAACAESCRLANKEL